MSSPPTPSRNTVASNNKPPLYSIDYSFLTCPEFTNEADWLNSIILPNDDGGSNLESIVHDLESSLQDTSSLVDRSITEISSTVPRLSFDLQLMRENALLLKFTLEGIRKRGTGFDQSSPVGKVIEKIRVLDLIKQRMESSRDVLREAESWSSLEPEVSGLVQEGQYLKASERLQEAARSMVVFQNTKEYEQRRSLMISLQNQLEASLSSGLVKSITERDIKGCKLFYKIFGMIEREQEFVNYYFGSRRSTLVTSWSQAKLLDCQNEPSSSLETTTLVVTSSKLSSPDPLKFSQFLNVFYSEFLTLLTEERTYLPAIFTSNPFRILSNFLTTTLESLNPSFSTRLNSIQQTYQETFLLELIQIFKVTEEFSLQVERVFQKLQQQQQQQLPSTTTTTTSDSTHSPRSPSVSTSTSNTTQPTLSTPLRSRNHSISNRNRRKSTSKRLSSSRSISFAVGSSPFLHQQQDENGDHDQEEFISERGGGQEELTVREWETALFEPFLDFQTDYPRLEKQFLESEINHKFDQEASGGSRGGDWLEFIEPLALAQDSYSSGGITVTRRGPSSSNKSGTDKLLEKVNKLFQLFESSIQRNLALTHGYGSKNLLEVLDLCLVNFLDQRKDELGRVLKYRSLEKLDKKKKQRQQRRQREASSHTIQGGEAVDREDEEEEEEELVLEGLEYSNQDWEIFQFGLKLLDTCKRIEEKLNSFESKLRNRMIVLAKSLKLAREGGGGSSLSSFTAIPGTTRGEILLLRQSSLNSVELNQMLEGLEGGGSSSRFLLPKSKGASIEFTKSTQLFLHETILSPLQLHLSEYSSLPCWTTSTDRVPGGKGAFDLSIPTFSLSPTETISRVGEGLFNLPRLFEVYAQDDSLSYSIETLPFIDLDQLRQYTNNDDDNSEAPTTTTTTTTNTLSRSDDNNQNIPLPPLTAETVILTWLTSLTLSILSHLTTTVLPSLTRLSKHGSSQLVSDLDYISNVARALEVETSFELMSWREAVAMDEKTLREGGGDMVTKIDRGILERLMKIRGVRRGSV